LQGIQNLKTQLTTGIANLYEEEAQNLDN